MVRFSVVIPLYNKRQTIERCLRSVEDNGSDLIHEVVVVNDGSTDGGEAVVERFAQRNPKVRLVSQENQGVSAARNAGISACASEHVLLLDADDEWRPTFVRTIADLVSRHPDAILFATAYKFVWASGVEGAPSYRFTPTSPEGGYIDDFLACIAAGDPPVWSSCVALRRSAFLEAGGFPVGVSHGEDKIFWLRMARIGRFAWTPKVEVLRHETPDANSDASWTSARGRHYLDEIGRFMQLEENAASAPAWRKLYARELAQYGRAAARAGERGVALRAASTLLRHGEHVQAGQVVAALMISRRLYASLRALRRSRRGRAAHG